MKCNWICEDFGVNSQFLFLKVGFDPLMLLFYNGLAFRIVRHSSSVSNVP
jgi:hypothetical protein